MTEKNGMNGRWFDNARKIAQAPATRRWGMGLGISLVLVALFAFLAGPPLLKSFLLKTLSAELRRDVQIERIEINPLKLSARIEGLSVKAEDGREVLAFDELLANVSLGSVFRWGLVVDELRLKRPRISLIRLDEGRYDISDLLDQWLAPKDEVTPTPRFSLNNIRIVEGQIDFDDRPVGRQHRIAEMELAIPFISSLAYYADVWVEPGFSANVNGALLNLKGRSRPFSSSHESELDLAIDRFDLTSLQPYLPAGFPVRIEKGAVDGHLKLIFRAQADQVPSLVISGELELADLDVREASGQGLLAWKVLKLPISEADPLNKRFLIGAIELNGLLAQVDVDRSGQLNWLKLIDRSTGKPSSAPAAPPAQAATSPVLWSVAGIELRDGRVRWQDQSGAQPVRGELADLQVKVGEIDGKLAQPVGIEQLNFSLDFGEAMKTGPVRLSGIQVALAERRADIDSLTIDAPRLKMLRNKQGELHWLTPPNLRAGSPSDKPGAPQAPWLARLNQLAVNDLAFRLEDQTTSPTAVQVIDKLVLQGEGLTNEAGKAGKISLASRINDKGNLKVGGAVQLSPLKAELQLDTIAVPLLPLQPYFTEFLNISLTRGQLSNTGQIHLVDQDGLRLNYRGSLTLGDLLTVDKVNNADLLKWKSLYLGGIDFKLSPMSVNVGEIALSDFYSRLIISPSGKLNLSELVRQPTGKPEVPATAEAKAAPSATTASTDQKPLPITIGRVTLQGGTINFSDYFVKPNYTVNITKVGGRVSKLSSTDSTPADMELRGTYANASPVNIVAKLNPLAANAYLDLKAEVSGVDLVPFSPYAGKYAGYAIDKGKLSMNVAYTLENGQLRADNRLFIDQLTFGEKIESPTATSLPVNLAIALLKNNRGEIDLNLPISGSLDDPDFSVGGLIVKVIVNLFVKAVTSPFALIGSLFGGGEELSNVEFLAGRANFSEAAIKRMEALAKAMRERAALKLEITGRAEPEVDLEGLKRAAVDLAVRAEKQKEMIRKSKESGSLESIEISPAEYPVYLQKAYKEAKFPKPRNLVGLLKELPVEEMEKLMLTNQPVKAEDVRQLAIRRAEAVQSWLVEQGKVPAERVFLLPPKVGTDEKQKATRVDFSLR